ncbi:uncharacterized protein LOC134212961 isoform X2 [Armigeres subalbatus]|uniref:uncharacterized protein LOC134212961 isoform X2 n=1 Tax=Armigeres subalbatus TaxID=124917 RepID=UPI002ED19479
MIKLGVVVLLVIGTCTADLAAWDDGSDLNVNRKHFSQHEVSVNAARKGAAERLARLGSGVASNPCGTTICYSNSGYSDNSDAETLGHGIVGFNNAGAAGSSSSSSKYQASSHQQSVAGVVPVYPVHTSSKSSYSSESQRRSLSSVNAAPTANYINADEGIKTRSNFGTASGAAIVQPISVSAYPIGQESSQSSFSSGSRSSNQDVYTVPVYSGTNADHTSKYVAASSSRQDNQQRYSPSNTYVVYRQPVPVYGPFNTGSFDTSARFANSNNQGTIYPVPVVLPARSTSNQYAAAKDQKTYIVHGTQPVYSVSSDQSSLANQNSHAQYVRPAYQPIYNNHLASSQESHVRASESGLKDRFTPVPFGASASNYEEEARNEEYSRKGSTYVRPVPVVTASSNREESQVRNEEYSRKGNTYVRPVPVVTGSAIREEAEERNDEYSQKGSAYIPVALNTASTASRYSQDQQRIQSGSAYVPIPVASASESHNQQRESSSSSSQYSAAQHQRPSSGGWYYPAAGSAAAVQGSRYSAYDSQNALSQQRVGGYVPITNDALGQRFGATGLEVGGSGTELGSIMSESERLARLQAKNAYNGAVSGSSAIDTENRFGGNNDDTSSDLGGGFKRTKSWSSSSKWASGQKYGDDGKIKTYSSLSTAESEQHNINGQKAGYKAATTTLEDDGKVSTYSLHTQ